MADETVVIAPTLSADPSVSDLRVFLDSEPEAAAETAPETTETPAGEKTASTEPEPAAASEPAPKTEPKTESAIDKRFAKLAAQRDEARQRADKAERELLARPSPPGPSATPVTEALPAADTGKPKPPDPNKWTGTWEELESAKLDYVEKLTDWKVSERDRKAATDRQQADARTLHTTWEAKSKAFGEANPDFEEAIADIGPKVTQAGVADLIKDSPVGPDMVLYLHQHPEEVTRMGNCKTQAALARELGKLEAQLSAPHPETTAAAPKARLPKPPASIGGGQPATVDLNTCDQRTFNREVKKQLAA
jgi:hypothetical protein